MTWGPAVFGGGNFAGPAGLVDAVDTPSALEFMREALVKISEEDIGTVVDLLALKREVMRPLLSEDTLASANADAVRPILSRVFATRRRAEARPRRARHPAIGDQPPPGSAV